MQKIYEILHRIITHAAWCLLIYSFVYLLFIYKMLPQEIGVHFSAEGTFDLYDDKINAFYPYKVGFVVLFISELAIWLAKRIKSGLKVDEQGERRLKAVAILWIDVFKFGISIYFTYWSCCVVTQSAMCVPFVQGVIFAIGGGLLLLILAAVVIRILNAGKK